MDRIAKAQPFDLVWRTTLPLALALVVLGLLGVLLHQREMDRLVTEHHQDLAEAMAVHIDGQIAALIERVDQTRSTGTSIDSVTRHLDSLPSGTDAALLARDAGQWSLVWQTEPLDASAAETAPNGAGGWPHSIPSATLISLPVGGRPEILSTSGTEPWTHLLLGMRSDDGVLLVRVPIPALGLTPFLAEFTPEHEGGAALYDRTGRLISRVARDDLPGAERTAAVQEIPHLGWTLEIREPQRSPAMRASLVAPFLMIVAVVAVTAGLLFERRAVVDPLRELGRRAQRLPDGDFDAVREPVGGIQAIEDLRLVLHGMARDLESAQRGLHGYIGEITRAQEEERLRLARELHDGLVQDVAAIAHKAELISRTAHRDSAKVPAELAELQTMARAAWDDSRAVIRNLRPPFLEDLGLPAALDALTSVASSDASIELRVVGAARRLAPDVELALYRIAQESVSNALRHSGASQIAIRLDYLADGVVLTTNDDGRGFPVTETNGRRNGSGFGLIGIKERAADVGGSLHIDSRMGRGTTVSVTVPTEDVPPNDGQSEL